MIRFKFSTVIGLLLLPATVCGTLSSDLEEIYKSIQKRICKPLNSSEDFQTYINLFDEYWNLTDALDAMAKVKQNYQGELKENCTIDGYQLIPDYFYGNSGYRGYKWEDMQCFIRDLPAVAPNYKADLIRFYNLKNGAQWSIECSALEIFLSAWHTHPVLSKLECYYGRDPNHRHMYSLYQQMYDSGRFWIGSEATNWAQNLSSNFTMSNNMTCKMVYSKSVVKGLRDEIKPICPSPFDLRLCWLNINMKLADTEDRFLEYVKSSAPVTAHYMDALQLYIYAIIKEMDVRSPNPWDIVPNKHGMEYHIFLNTYYHPIWIPTKVNNLMMYIFNNTHALVNSDTEKGLQLQLIMDLLPTDYQCESFAEVGSLCWTVNMFNEMIKAFKQNLNAPNTNKKILVNTDIDYRAFLEHTQTERLLKLSETSQNNLVTIATELRDDIVYSIEQSAAESTNKIAGVVQSGFDGLKKHFQQEASFDKSIAKADIAFINAEITKYTKSLEYLTRRVFELVGYILKNTMGAVIGDAAEKLVHLLVVIASAFNPLKWLFDGGSVVEIAEAAAELAQAAAKVVLSVTFMTAWSNLLYLSSHFATALADNQAYLENIGKLVESLSADTPPPDFEKQKELFIKGYNDYSPAVNIEDLTQINTYWELIIDEACDLLDSTEGLSSAGIKMATNKACFDAPGEVQKFIALNEEIFEFQFDMMDALTECVRASNSYEAATAISTGLDNIQEVVSKDRESNVLEELKMLAAYSSMLYKVSVIEAKSKYCNVLEYREGSRPEVCKTHDWNLANLLSRNQASYHSTQDFKTVPTRPAFTGDKAFIDLKDLYAGKVVRFQVPNSDWLVNRGWIPTNDRNKPIFVQRFEVYLPVGSTSEKQVSVQAEATVGNQLRRDGDGGGTEYVISPRRSFTFTYKEGQETCRNEEIPNPYNTNCRTMPDLCQISTDVSDTANTASVYPSIYAMWHIQLTGYETANLSLPLTNVDVMIGLQTATPVGFRRRRSVVNTGSNYRSRRSFGTQKCCENNMFLNETAMCEQCPPNSVAKYNALLCECKPCKNGGQLVQTDQSCSCLCDHKHKGQFCEIVKCNKRLGSTCTEDVPTTTTETPSVNPGSQGQLGNGTIADINAGFQNLHDGLQNINKNIGEMGGKLEGMDKNMGEIGGALNSIEGKIGGGLQAVEGKMDGGLQNIEEALLNVNENLQLLMEKLEAQEDHDNGGDTGTEGQVGSDHGAPNPDWWSEPNFPLGRR